MEILGIGNWNPVLQYKNSTKIVNMYITGSPQLMMNFFQKVLGAIYYHGK